MKKKGTPAEVLRKNLHQQVTNVKKNNTQKKKVAFKENGLRKVKEKKISEKELAQRDLSDKRVDDKISIVEEIIGEDNQVAKDDFSSENYWKGLAREGGKLLRIAVLIFLGLVLLTVIARAAEILLGIKLIPILAVWIGHDYLSFFIYTLKVVFR